MSSRIEVFLEYPCVTCGVTLSRPSAVLSHMETKHNTVLPARPYRARRPASSTYRYVPSKANATAACVTHVACPSCWEHFPDQYQLQQHIQQSHLHVVSDGNEGQVGEHQLHPYQQQGLHDSLAEIQQQHISEAQSATTTSTYLMSVVEDLITSLKNFTLIAAAPTANVAATTSKAPQQQRSRTTANARKKKSVPRRKREDSFISYDEDDINSQASYVPSDRRYSITSESSFE